MNNPHNTAAKLSGRIVTNSGVINGTIHTDGAIITAIEDAGVHNTGQIIVPGFVDLHNHGGFGGAFPTGTLEEARRAALYHRKQGSTTLLASLVSAPPEKIIEQLKVLGQLYEEGLIYGIHLEGPFINACRCGAQNPDYIFPGSPQDFEAIINAGNGHIRSITMAPETDHLEQLLDLCAQHNIIVSFGHTDASFETTARAVSLATAHGLTVTATHLFNAMPPLHHRAPGAAGAMLAAARRGEAYLELVADGVHLADGTVDFALSDHAFFVTDAMEAAGMPDGTYILGELGVEVTNGVARLSNGGAIAGGTSTLAQQFKHHVSRGMTLFDASRHTSTIPAQVLGLPAHGIEVGNPLNVVVFDSNGSIERVYVEDKII